MDITSLSLRGAESGISAAADNSRDLTQVTKQSKDEERLLRALRCPRNVTAHWGISSPSIDLSLNKILLQIPYFGYKFAIMFRRAWRQAGTFYQISGSKSSIFVTNLI